MEPTQENPVPVTPAPASQNPEEKTWAMFCHLAALLGILGPLVVWLVKKDTMPLVDDQGKESLNFQITLAIAGIVCIPLCFVCIGFVLLFAISVLDLVFIILAALQANKGVAYRYPFALRLIK